MIKKTVVLCAGLLIFLASNSVGFGKIIIQSDHMVDDLQGRVSHNPVIDKKNISTVSRSIEPPEPSRNSRLNPAQQQIRDMIGMQVESLQQFVENENQLMMNVVQLMDRPTAEAWMTSFISARPLNCPLKKQKEWIDAIISGVENNQLPLNKEILALVACIISIESGFHADPLAIDPSRGEDMSNVLDRAERDITQKLGPLMSVPPVPQFYQIYKEKYYPLILNCRTEGDVEAVARKVVDDLKKDSAFLPDFLKNILDKELNRVKNVVRTKGSMQLNFPRAIQVMNERGESFNEDELREYMYTLNGGVDVGIAALRPMFVQYAARYGALGNRSWLFFVGMDYHYGPFSSRNMMEQIRIKDLSGRDIAIDGDFLHYDDSGEPSNKESETLKAAESFLPRGFKSELFQNFLLEKHPHYIYTNTHQRILVAHNSRFGPTPFAIIGELWMGESAQIKHGGAWKTRNYLNKLDKYLNAIPWESLY